jgi:uncharacterized protein
MDRLPKLVVALLAGALMGFGLCVAQMVDPAKVVNFLDLAGTWDPSLALVMGGGLAVNAIATPFILNRPHPLFEKRFFLPTTVKVDWRIVFGGVLFGVGWGLGGYCPGPMITSLSFVDSDILTIVMAYVIGTLATRWWLVRAG